jgi:hypothetical protein
VLCIAFNAGLEKDGFLFSFILRFRGCPHGIDVRSSRDSVGFSNQCNFVFRLRHTASLDSELEHVKIRGLVGQESDTVRDLFRDGEDGRLCRGLWGREVRVDFFGSLDFIDIVLFFCFLNRHGQARPNHILGLDRRYEERQLVAADVVCEVRIRENATAQVEEESSLSKGSFAITVLLPISSLTFYSITP